MVRPVRSAGLAGLLMFAAAVLPLAGSPVRSAAAAPECLTAPDGTATAGRHWFYRLDRATNRKCWYLRDREPAARSTDTTGTLPAAGTATADPVVPVAPTLPTRHAVPSPTGRPLTADERATLYGEFLTWRLRQVPRHGEPDGPAAAPGTRH
ncbi:MAG: hypothetical protein HZA68_07535 [Rhodovulum sp.]|nr:hypothetical protein [Rhodovulum sp.]